MAFDDLLVSGNICASGMAAERMRMEVIANNVANAMATRTPVGRAVPPAGRDFRSGLP